MSKERRSEVLVAVGERDCPRYCLSRASELARALGGVLQVVRVLPAWRWLWRPLPWLERRARERARASLRATRFWLAGAYGEEPPAGQVVIRSGNFVREVCAQVSSRPVAFIVIPPDLACVGRTATYLAHATRSKVIVPREPVRSRAILAASDLATPGFPVLTEAARLGLALHAALISFHNVDPLAFMEDGLTPSPQRADARARKTSSPRARLEEATRALPAESTSALRAQIDPVSAIVEEARERRVDMVVVGAHARSRLERLVRGSVASEVVKRALCSVVVAPLLAPATYRVASDQPLPRSPRP